MGRSVATLLALSVLSSCKATHFWSIGGVRMAAVAETSQAIVDDLLGDRRLEALERSRLLHDETTWGRGITRADYDALPICRAFAFEAYPWK